MKNTIKFFKQIFCSGNQPLDEILILSNYEYRNVRNSCYNGENNKKSILLSKSQKACVGRGKRKTKRIDGG